MKNTWSRWGFFALLFFVLPALIGASLSFIPSVRGLFSSETGSTRKQVERKQTRDDIRGLGYLSGSEEAPEKTGVLAHEPAKAHQGVNFFCGGQGPRASLMSMDGTVLHRWELPWKQAFRNFPEHRKEHADKRLAQFWRNCFLQNDGSVIAIFGGLGIVKLNASSELLWAQPIRAHHDIWRPRGRTPGGKTYVMDRRFTRINIQDKTEDILVDDLITVLNGDAEPERHHSILQAIIQSDYRSLLSRTTLKSDEGISFKPHFQLRTKDALHTNSLQLLEAGHPFVQQVSDHPDEKHLLISARQVDSVFLMSLGSNRLEWNMSKLFQAQHDAKLLDNGNMLVFDNMGNHAFSRSSKNGLQYSGAESRILEIDPISQSIAWSYGDSPGERVVSSCCGLAQRLPNGNTLISETTSGRAIEVTREGEVVWEFRNPHGAINDPESIAWVFKMKRLDENIPTFWNED